MIWGNPWAWAGLAGIALPVLIHLLGRGHARVRRFPTLRFLDASRLLPTRRTRLHDLLLLALRVAIVVSGVAAMAQPLILTTRRSRAFGDPLARAIIVDTSASMQRATASNESGLTVARRVAAQLRDSASTSVVLETAHPSDAIAGASAWLLTQPSRGELDVVSDFQTGAIDSMDLNRVPRRLGVRLSRVDVRRDTSVESSMRIGGVEIVADVVPTSAGTSTRWMRRASTSGVGASVAAPLAADADRASVAAAEHAAAMIGVSLPIDTSRAIDLLYPGAARRAELLSAPGIPLTAWMTALVARLSSDSLLIGAAANADVVAHDTVGGAANVVAPLVVVRTALGAPVVSAMRTSVRDRDHLVLVSSADAGSLSSAALIAALNRAQSTAPTPLELDPSVLPERQLASWQRAPSPASAARANGREGPSDARWLWLLALLLIAVETWVRRHAPRSAETTESATTLATERTRVA